MFVGARDPSSSQIMIGAFGQSDAIFQATYSTYIANLNNGLYWYNKHGSSFGFSPVENVYLNTADTATDQSEYRMSWHIDQGVGGYRAGNMNPSGDYYKVIYKFPSGDKYPKGVQLNFPVSSLTDMGMVPCYEAPYDSATSQSSFSNCISPGDW